MKLKIGDRVVCTENINYIKSGMKGTVKGYHKNGAVGVEWDAFTNGHDGNGDGMVCAAGKGWYVPAHMLGPISHPSIHITTDGHTTYAIKKDGKKVIGRAEAVCSPHDEFDFDTGAKLAFNRLEYGTDYHPAEVELTPANEPITFYCVKDYKPGEKLTKGKTYTAKSDGTQLVFDNGETNYRSIFRATTYSTLKVVPNYLIPEVKRPAKVGEWIRVIKADGQNVWPLGTVGRVTSHGTAFPDWVRINGYNYGLIRDDEYVVLEGYQPEPEKPKGYSGKAVFVEGISSFTPGKVYAFVDGRVRDDNGVERPLDGTRINSFDNYKSSWSNRFIEFKGE